MTVPPTCVKPAPEAKPVVLSLDHKTLADYEIPESGGQLRLKDLGPQIDYQMVFFIEYVRLTLKFELTIAWSTFDPPFDLRLGTYHLPHQLQDVGHADVSEVYDFTDSRTIYLLIIAHFIKREFESALVHKFSHATMPVANVFRK